MLDDVYLQALYSKGRRSIVHTLVGYWHRGAHLRGLGECDLVICDQEFLPYFPPFVEAWLASRCSRLIVDYDDAAYFKYQGIPGLRNRIAVLMAAAEAVVVGNRYLEEYAARHSRNVHLIPTVVDTSRYEPKQDYAAHEGVRLVWIGTPITAGFLQPMAPVLTALHEKYADLQLRLVGAGNVLRDALPFAEVVEWSEAYESKLLAECDVGLMPLPDNDFTRGKCGLKLIQYMAAGLPVVGSPVGANRAIISEGEDGYLAEELKDWHAGLERLITSEDLRREFGRKGATKARQKYSLEHGFEAWMNLIKANSRAESKAAYNAAAPVGRP